MAQGKCRVCGRWPEIASCARRYSSDVDVCSIHSGSPIADTAAPLYIHVCIWMGPRPSCTYELDCFGHSPTCVLPDRRRHLGPDVAAIASTPHDLPFCLKAHFMFFCSAFRAGLCWLRQTGWHCWTRLLRLWSSPPFPSLNFMVRWLARRRPHGNRNGWCSSISACLVADGQSI